LMTRPTRFDALHVTHEMMAAVSSACDRQQRAQMFSMRAGRRDGFEALESRSSGSGNNPVDPPDANRRRLPGSGPVVKW